MFAWKKEFSFVLWYVGTIKQLYLLTMLPMYVRTWVGLYDCTMVRSDERLNDGRYTND
jgi:hypothetical protein